MHIACQYTQELMLSTRLPFCFHEEAMEGPSPSAWPSPTLTTTHIPCLSSAVSPTCTASYPSPPKPTPSHIEIFSSSLETLSFLGHLNLPILVKSSVLKPYLPTMEGNHWRKSHHWIFSTLLGLRHFICKMRMLSRTSRNCEVQRKA